MCPHGRLDVAVVQGFDPGIELAVPLMGWDIILYCQGHRLLELAVNLRAGKGKPTHLEGQGFLMYRQGAGGCGLHSPKGCSPKIF